MCCGKDVCSTGLQTQPEECLLRAVLPHQERVVRVIDGQSHCTLRVGLNDWRLKEKKCNHLHLLLKSQKEFDEKDMFQKL